MKKVTFNFLLRKAIFLFAIFFLVFLFSCKKDGELSPDFDNGNLSILFTDTFSVQSSLVKEDSLRTDKVIHSLLGLYNDPVFGPRSSSIYTQVSLTGLNVNFGSTTAMLDSVVLTLGYAGLFGDTLAPITVNVYELNEDLLSSSSYYSNDVIAHYPTILGASTFVPNLSDSVKLDFNDENKTPHLRIKLDDAAFGQKLMDGDADNLNKMVNNEGFLDYMKGLYVATSETVSNTSLASGTGSIASFDMNSAMSTLTLYYNDTMSYDFTINEGTVKYSHFDHNYAGTDIEAQLNQLTTRDTTLTYVSSMAGVRTKLEIPYLKDILRNGTVAINKAELVITIENGTDGDFDKALESLALTGIDANGQPIFLIDNFDGTQFINNGGDIESSGNFKTYTFNISRHIHDLIYNTTIDYGMYLLARGGDIISRRSILGTDKNIVSKMKLNITYSKL